MNPGSLGALGGYTSHSSMTFPHWKKSESNQPDLPHSPTQIDPSNNQDYSDAADSAHDPSRLGSKLARASFRSSVALCWLEPMEDEVAVGVAS